jgi:hypothetical protein
MTTPIAFHHFRPTATALLVALLVAVAGATSARAQDAAGPGAVATDAEAAKAGARARMAEGARLLEAGDHARALAEFEAAYLLVPSSKILFNVGLAYMGLGRHADAIRAFEQFTSDAKNVPPAAIADAQRLIDGLRSKVGAVEVAVDQPGVDITIDGRALGKTPLAPPVYHVDPGEHRLTAQGDRAAPAVTQVFKIGAGERQVLKVVVPALAAAPAPVPPAATLVAAPAPAGVPDTERPLYRKPWFWGVAGAGVAALVLTVVLIAGRSTDYPDASLGRVAGD